VPEIPRRSSRPVTWTALAPNVADRHKCVVLLVWAPWNSHSPQALVDMNRFRNYLIERKADAGVYASTEFSSRPEDRELILSTAPRALPEVDLAPAELARTGAMNQIPATLLFRDGVLIDTRLGAQTFESLREWFDRTATAR
jgi:hypothetical protein